MGGYKQALGGCCAAVLLLGTGTVQAALSEPIDGMVYDNVLNLCWLQDASASGEKPWVTQVEWAANLTFGGHDDWRLARMANTSPTDSISDCGDINEDLCRFSGNELEYHLYHNLGGSFPLTGNQGPFINIPRILWSGTEQTAVTVWAFDAGRGDQGAISKTSRVQVWAVRSGRCQPGSFYPEPIPALGAWGLGLLGLGLLLSARARLGFKQPG